MDPVTFYTIGNIRHKEFLDDAERNRRFKYAQATPNLWQRFRARLSAALTPKPAAQNRPAIVYYAERVQPKAAADHRNPVSTC